MEELLRDVRQRPYPCAQSNQEHQEPGVSTPVTIVVSGEWSVLHCARWRRVDSGWKVGAALGSHRKCVPWFKLRLAAHASPSAHVTAIARCWRSRKATVPKEVLCGARSPRGAHPTTSGRMWMYLCLERAASHRCNVGGGGRLSMEV